MAGLKDATKQKNPAAIGVILFGLLLIGVYLSSFLIDGFPNIKITPLIFIAGIGIILFVILRLLGVSDPQKTLQFEDFFILFMVGGAVIAFFVFFPQFVPTNLSLVTQSIGQTLALVP
tara:strand:- start:4861 stop:5214 length:354 start_codon:yes stop_codon:yes gene_type:complete